MTRPTQKKKALLLGRENAKGIMEDIPFRLEEYANFYRRGSRTAYW